MNLIIVPLEGMSQLLFWRCIDTMPTLWNLSNDSIFFRRFYTSSTSSFSSFCDLLYGDSAVLDDNANYAFQPGCLKGKAETLLDVLAANGHVVFGLQHGNPCPDHAQNGFWGAWPEKSEGFQTHGEYSSFHSAADSFLERMAAASRPFTLYFCDRASRLDDRSPEKDASRNLSERMDKGFSLVDKSVERLLVKLDSLGLLAKTVIAVVGLYGMDPWKHGVNMGRIYGTEPYADLSWTPFFLNVPGNDVSIADQLISMIDLKPTILPILLPGIKQQRPGAITQGVNVQELSRYYAFTQNLLPLEPGLRGSREGLPKSYGVTDGDLRLLASVDLPADGGGGMELYYDPRDPGNTRNFLDFFRINDDGDIYAAIFTGVRHSHFLLALNPDKMASIIKSYNFMRTHLQAYVTEKEENALRLAGSGNTQHRFPKYVFRRKRRRR